MSFELHLGILLLALAAFAIWPNFRRQRAFQSRAEIEGTPCNFKQRRASRSRSYTLTVSLPCDQRFEFTLRPEGGLDRAAKTLRLVREFQTNDDQFDGAIYIGADEQGIDDWLAKDQEARKTVLDLLTEKPNEFTTITELTASDGVLTLSATANPAWLTNVPDELDLQLATLCVPPMRACLERLQAFAKSDFDPGAFRDPYATAFRTLSFLSLGLLLVPILFFPVDDFYSRWARFSAAPWIDRYGLIASASVIVAVTLLGFAFMRGSARIHTVLISLVVAVCIGAPVAAIPLVRELNTQWDGSAPHPYPSLIMQRYQTGGKSRTYHLVLTDWHEPGKEQDIHVDEVTYTTWNEGDQVIVWEGSGYLNERWISAITRPASSDKVGSP